MDVRKEMLDLIEPHIDRAIYVWGRVGEEVPSEQWIRAYETSSFNAERAIELYRKRLAAGIYPVHAFDCSGLIVYTLRKLGISDLRYTAEGLRRVSPPTDNPQPGDFAFKLHKTGIYEGQAYHVGIIPRAGKVWEARGRDVGVVETNLVNWHVYGSNPFVKEDSMLQRGSKGAEVAAWQRALMAWDEAALPRFKDDGDFGAETELWTNNFKNDAGLSVNGVVDDATWAHMTDYLIKNDGVPFDEHEAVQEALQLCQEETLGYMSQLYQLQDEVSVIVDAQKKIDEFNAKHGA